jgi:acetyl esterase/lipase
MKKLLFSMLAALLVFSSCSKDEITNSTNNDTLNSQRTWSNVVYAAKSSANKLDIYLPATGDGPFPVIVWIHGGAFKMGSKSMVSGVEPYLVGKGYAVVSIDYRLSGEAIFPAQIYDVKAAIRFLKANAATYKLNPEKFATWGESAGAGLASLAGTSGGVASLEDMSMGNSSQNSTVQATVDLFGPIDFLTMNSQWIALGVNGQDHDAASSPESILVGGAIQTKPEMCNMYNPETYITADDPAFYIEHGSADVLIPYLQAETFYNKLVPVIGTDKAKYKLLNGASHADAAFNTTSNLDLLVAFLDKYLK